MSCRCTLASTRIVKLLGYAAGVLTWTAPVTAQAATVANPLCPGESAQFNPGNGEDIVVPPGFKVSRFASGSEAEVARPFARRPLFPSYRTSVGAFATSVQGQERMSSRSVWRTRHIFKSTEINTLIARFSLENG